MRVDGAWRRAIERGADGELRVLDQTALPHRVAWCALPDLAAAARAIRDMIVRGAPLIGVTAAYGVALGLRDGVPLADACATLAATRPTAAAGLRPSIRRSSLGRDSGARSSLSETSCSLPFSETESFTVVPRPAVVSR